MQEGSSMFAHSRRASSPSLPQKSSTFLGPRLPRLRRPAPPSMTALSASIHKYGCIRAPLHPPRLCCAPSLYATVRLSRAPRRHGASTLSVRHRIYELKHLVRRSRSHTLPSCILLIEAFVFHVEQSDFSKPCHPGALVLYFN